MKLVSDDFINKEIKEYLLTQEGIIDVELNENHNLTTLDIKYNENITPNIILKYIELFQNRQYSILFEFDKNTKGNFNILEYVIDDMCCDYCYRRLVTDLFENEHIKSVKSNFNYQRPAFNIKFIIEYDNDYTEEELIKYIKEKYN